MKLDGRQEFDVSSEQIWEAVFDEEILVGCIPGAKVIERTSATTFEGEINRGLASINVTMDLSVEVVDDRRPDQIECRLEGRDNRINSTVDGAAVITIDRHESGGSVLTYDVDLDFTGRLVSLGSRLIKRQMNNDLDVFFERLEETFADSQATTGPS